MVQVSEKDKDATWEPNTGGVLDMANQLNAGFAQGLYFLVGLEASAQQELEEEAGDRHAWASLLSLLLL